MSWNATDGFFLVTTLAGVYYAYHTIPDTLNHIRNLAACPEPAGPGPRKQLQKDAENAIGIETLRILSEGHSYDLRATTIKIVASRTLKSRTKKLLLKDLASRDEDKRYQAVCAIWMLLFNPGLQVKHCADEFLDYKSFHAIITALENVLMDHKTDRHMHLLTPGNLLYPEPKIPPSPIRPPVRPYHEMSLMMILRHLLDAQRPYDRLSDYPDNITCALSAGMVTRWLKYYPFPCTLPQNLNYNYKKSDVVNLLEGDAWASDDPNMAGLVHAIKMTAMGKQQLRDAGLSGSSYTGSEGVENTVGRWRHFPTRLDTLDTDRDIRMTNGESTAGAATPPPISFRRHWTDINGELPHARAQELSQEEENLRRRRREAVVVADAGVPLSQDSILQRTDSGNVWHSDAESTVEDDVDTTTASSILATYPEMLSTPSFEERFNLLLQPLLAQQAILQSLRDEAVENHDLDSDAVLDGFREVTPRIQEYRNQIGEIMEQWELPEDERKGFMRRLNHIMNDMWNEEQLNEMMAMARQRRSASGNVEAQDVVQGSNAERE